MSCYSPLVVKNPKARFESGFDSLNLEVPCGACLGCATDQQNEWMLRAYYQYKKYKQNGGFCVFITLTYNDESLPKFYDKFHNKTFSCFDKKHLDTWLNSIRKVYERKGITNNNSLGVSYLICSEFGDVRNTCRPHYHALLFLPCIHLFRYSDILSRIKRLWKYGFADYSSHGAIVNSEMAVKYVCKYISKDVAFHENVDIRNYINFISNPDNYEMLEQCSVDDPFRNKMSLFDLQKSLLKEFKRYSQRHFQSKGFGLLMLDELKSYSENRMFEVLQTGLSTPGSVLSTGQHYYYKIPSYIKKKILYNQAQFRDDDGIIHDVLLRNDTYYKFRAFSLPKVILKETESLISSLSPDYLSTVTGCSYDDACRLSDKILKPINYDFEKLAIYKTCFFNHEWSEELCSLFNVSKSSDLFDKYLDIDLFFHLNYYHDIPGSYDIPVFWSDLLPFQTSLVELKKVTQDILFKHCLSLKTKSDKRQLSKKYNTHIIYKPFNNRLCLL